MEYVLASLWFWLGIIALVAIIGGFVISAIGRSGETKRYLADAANGGAYKQLAEAQAEQNRRLLERLDTLDARLASVEKTLTDIPG